MNRDSSPVRMSRFGACLAPTVVAIALAVPRNLPAQASGQEPESGPPTGHEQKAPQEPQDPQESRDRVLSELEEDARQRRGEEPSEPDAATRGLTDAAAFPVHGTWSVRYRLRDRGQDSDQDLLSFLSLDFGDSSRNPVTGHFHGRLYGDLDGSEPSPAFRGIDETFGDFNVRIYEAYADVHELGPVSYLRVGRQSNYETPVEVLFDGARVEIAEHGAWRIGGTLYTGVPNHLYESSASGDFLGGGALHFRPWYGARWRVDYLYVEDDLPSGNRQNDFWGIGLWQDLGGHSQVHAGYTWLEGEGRDLRLRGNSWIEDLELNLNLSYYELFTTQRQLVTEFDPYFEQAFDYFPYRQWGARATKELGEHLWLTTEFDIRRLSEAADEGQFNREFERYAIGPGIRDLFLDDVSLSVLGELWHSDGERIETVAGDIRADVTDSTRIDLGTAYFLYKVDTFTGLERDHVRAWYLRLRQDLGSGVRLDGRYEYEKNDFDTFHTFRIGMTWTF